MSSEARRGLIRITSNYARLITTCLIGLVIVRLLLRTLGNDAFAMITLLASTVGFSAMIQEIVSDCMIRELGNAHHRRDPEHFKGVYNSALVLSSVAAVVAMLIFVGVLFALPWLEIPEAMIPAGRWLVAARGTYTFFVVLLAPAFNMYVISERMLEANFWRVVIRSCDLISAVLLLWATQADVSGNIVRFGLWSSGTALAAQISAVVILMTSDRRLVPALSNASWAHFKSLLGMGKWNLAVVTASNLHLRLDAIIMNLAFGLFGNLIFGLAVQATSYVRMIATGMTAGVDAVAARLSTVGHKDSLSRLVYHSTRLHGLVTFPTALGMMLLADPFLHIWVGPRIEDPATSIPPTVTIIRALSLGITVQAIADGWVRILYGAGHIRRYAPVVLLGGLINPGLATLLVWSLPQSIRFLGPAYSYSLVLLIIHMGVLPVIAASLLGVSIRELFAPLAKPLAIALLCAPILLAAEQWVPRWNLFWLAGAAAAYGVVYVALATAFVLEPHERRRLWDAAARRLGLISRPHGSASE